MWKKLNSIVKFPALFCGIVFGLFITGCSSDKQSTDKASTPKDEKLQNGIAMGKDELAEKQDVPVYPGATAPEGESSVTKGTGETKYVLQLLTSDPFKKVAAFYEAKLPKISSICNSTGCDLIGPTPKGRLVQIKIGLKDSKTTISVVAIVEYPAKTK